jgi:O-Antigen ligase
MQELSAQYKYFGLITRIIIVCLYLTPSFSLYSGFSIRLEELVIISFFFWFAIQDKIRINWGLNQTLHCCFCVFILISILVGASLGYDNSLGDLNQLIRIFKYVFIYTVAITAVNTHPNPNKERILLFEFIIITSAILSLIAIQQYFDLFGLNKFYVLSISHQGRALVDDYPYPRAMGLVGNPNDLGFMATISTLISCVIIFYKTEQTKVFTFLFLLNFFCVLVSVSRGALIATVIGILLITFTYLNNKKIRTDNSSKKIIMIFVILSVAMFALLANQTMQDQMLWRFFAIQDISEDESWAERDMYWKGNLDLFQRSPLWGVGPLRKDESVGIIADNEWFLLLRCYGIIGTVFLLMVFIIPQFINLKLHESSTVIQISKLNTLAVFVGALLYMVPAVVYHSLVLMPIVLIATSISDMSSKTFILK